MTATEKRKKNDVRVVLKRKRIKIIIFTSTPRSIVSYSIIPRAYVGYEMTASGYSESNKTRGKSFYEKHLRNISRLCRFNFAEKDQETI